MKYKISNPYESVSHLIENEENHYKTNLHTHSTYSDANHSLFEMVNGFYDNDFDILAFTDHGVLGKKWDEEPNKLRFYFFQLLWHGKRKVLTSEQFSQVLDGTYKTKENKRTKKRGMMCVADCIEGNMFVIMLNHVNGFFTDDACEGIWGEENDYDDPLQKIEASGGISHINHPTDWLQAKKHRDCCDNPENVEFFANLFRKYKSCVGMEVLNSRDIFNPCDRILWDKLLQVLLPEGRKTIWGFSNSDAHKLFEIDTSFMDFILPEYSEKNLRDAMENGKFFSVSRYAQNELGSDFIGSGPWPKVTKLSVDHENETITIKGINCNCIEWIANGEVIKSETEAVNGEIVSSINLSEHSDKITCYVRAQLKGDGGICFTQPFTVDDGNMEKYKLPRPEPRELSKKEKRIKKFYSTKIGAIIYKKNC